MVKQRWIIGALLLLLCGAMGITYCSVQKHTLQRQIQQAALSNAHNQVSKDYLLMYEQWSALPAEEKSESPWGQGQYGGPDIQKKLREGQSDRFLAELSDLESNASRYPQELAEVLYGKDWREQLADYQKDRSKAEIILIGSIFFLAGGTIVGVGLSARWLVTAVLKKPALQEQPSASAGDKGPSASISETSIQTTCDPAFPTETQVSVHKKKKEHKEGYFQSHSKGKQGAAQKVASTEEKPLPLTERLSVMPSVSPQFSQENQYFGWAVELEEKPELKTLMTTEPLTKELSELTEEVSAIRHFAAQQQDQVRKLQDGYDWMIVRRFCMRIIRCVDNIEERISRLDKADLNLSDHLQDIRDELIFALESGGVEQYEPDLNVSYKGLERYAEAIKERVHTKDPSKAGFIADIIRPGYQYLVNDEDVKIVRCAQVKLYEVNQ